MDRKPDIVADVSFGALLFICLKSWLLFAGRHRRDEFIYFFADKEHAWICRLPKWKLWPVAQKGPPRRMLCDIFLSVVVIEWQEGLKALNGSAGVSSIRADCTLV
jgi:hypothetical protein